jgi:hypothetical protein
MCGAAIERPHLLTDKSDQGEPPIAAPLFVFQSTNPNRGSRCPTTIATIPTNATKNAKDPHCRRIGRMDDMRTMALAYQAKSLKINNFFHFMC